MLKVTLISATGREYLLTGSQLSSSVLAPESELVGLAGEFARADMQVPGRAGVVPGIVRYGALLRDVNFFLHADTGEEMEKLYWEFRRGWSKTKPSVFCIEGAHPMGAFYLDVTLGQDLPGVPVDASKRTDMSLPVKVYNQTGLFRSSLQSGAGGVTVTNVGDSLIYPKIRHGGAGGEVVCPSGAKFQLPKDQLLIDLDPRELRTDGVLPEAVPAGVSSTWQLPDGASLEWEILVADPW